MLVLKRKVGESVMIGSIEVTILGKDANQIALGIEAPKHFKIYRKEKLNRYQDGIEVIKYNE